MDYQKNTNFNEISAVATKVVNIFCFGSGAWFFKPAEGVEDSSKVEPVQEDKSREDEKRESIEL